MRKIICSVIVTIFLLLYPSVKSYSQPAAPQPELEWDYLIPVQSDRNLDTISLHILKKISKTQNKSIYHGITITHPSGDITWENQRKNSSALGIGPIYMLRYEKAHSNKLSATLDISGGIILYDKRFPAGGEYYNFMWRISPKLMYRISKNASLNIGYTLMHVSNGLKENNPSYDARGVSIAYAENF